MRFNLKSVLLAGALAAAPLSAAAQETIIMWDFFTGGDGVRMKSLLEKFNTEHAGRIAIETTTLEWGVPFYTKVQTSAAIGEAPDVVSYHLSRLPASVENGVLAEISVDDLAAAGLTPADFSPNNWAAAQIDGKVYAVPFDMHPAVLYYNKDKLAAAGLLGEDGLPVGLDGVENFTAALQKLKDAGNTWAMANFTANGDFQTRTIYSLFGQQDGVLFENGEFLPGDNLDKMVNAVQVLHDWVANGFIPAQTDYPAALALFTTGEAPLHINGVWEVPSLTDMKAAGTLPFEWGAIELPAFFAHPATWADSHSFAIPLNQGKEMTPEKKAAVLEFIAWMSKNSISWATAGHIPAYLPVTMMDEFKQMQPNATYAVIGENVVFDPKTSLAGVASPVQEAAGNDLTSAVNAEEDPRAAVERFKESLQALL
jgi:multiple sugar transport system substrate-binding protein